MSSVDFFEVVAVRSSSSTEGLGIAGSAGVVVGIAEGGSRTTYAVSIGGETYSVSDEEIDPTGVKLEESDFYSGVSVRVTGDGHVITGEADE